LKAEVASLNSQLEAALTQVRQFEDGIWDRRMIDPGAWYARLTKENVLVIGKFASIDKVAIQFFEKLTLAIEARNADSSYFVSLDDRDITTDIAYLVSIGALSAEDETRLLADSRRDEQ